MSLGETMKQTLKYVGFILAVIHLSACEPSSLSDGVQKILSDSESEVKRDKVTELNNKLDELGKDPSKAKEKSALLKCMVDHNLFEEPFRVSVCYDSALENIDNPWNIRESKSVMEDTKDVFITTSSSKYSNKYGQTHSTRLFVRCKENTTALIFGFDEYLGLDETTVQYRLDTEKAKSRTMGISTNNKSAGLWNGNSSIPVIKSLFGKKQLAVRVTPYGENPREMTFNIEGLEEMIQPLRESCNW